MSPLNKREEHAAAMVAQGKRPGTALRAAGLPRTRANRLRFSHGGDLQKAVADYASKAGLSLPEIVREHAHQLQAKTTKFFAHEGVVIDSRDVEDNGTRLRAVELGYRVHRVLGSEAAEAGDPAAKGPVVAIQINVAPRQAAAPPPVAVGVTGGIVLAVKPRNGNGKNGHAHG